MGFFLNCLTIYTLIYIIIAAILQTDKFSIGTEQQQNFVLWKVVLWPNSKFHVMNYKWLDQDDFKNLSF